ncbi:hypothetical protein PHISCL_09370 [Aspergillus sclerotialis]|uniref:Uncharacterized protein n=1 Tax=Aspergillus sclerotialis TaxID=2070753 RepID=A0A3A2Z7X0_9EURO|nr:hypothetical protein PHISCL_09370 [Aspergillus sclerotialis]
MLSESEWDEDQTSSSQRSAYLISKETGETRGLNNLKTEGYQTAPWPQYLGFCLLLFPTAVSFLLLASSARDWEVSGYSYLIITRNRTTVQIIVQIISNGLCLIQVFTVCRLINFATRIRFIRSPVSLNTLGLWTALSTPAINWSLPMGMIIASIFFVNLSTIISVLWTGAFTPVDTAGFRNGTVMIPDWTNRSFIQEYPSQVDGTGLSVRDKRGFFTYSVGVGLLGSLVTSAGAATTVDGSVRKHAKLDNTGYAYYGRSYGVGAGVGLMDTELLINPLATNYTFQEIGYDASVSCIYNHSTAFILEELPQYMLYAAKGPLPDSHGTREYSVYVGHSSRAIVAAGVTYNFNPSRKRYVGIAAGPWYAPLNATQCTIQFSPALFNISVGIRDRSIRVQKLTSPSPVPDIDSTHNVTHVATRQIELISNDLTSSYRSTLGDAFNASISDYRTSLSARQTDLPSHHYDENHITLTGLENAVTSLIDDILVGYASAQLVVGNFSKPVPANVQVSSLRLGTREYIIASASINGLIVFLLTIEALRTRGWKYLPSFDYLDSRLVVTSTSRGGTAIAAYDNETDEKGIGKIPILLRSINQGLMKFQVTFGAVKNGLTGSSSSSWF